MATLTPIADPPQSRAVEQRGRRFLVEDADHERDALDFAAPRVPRTMPDFEPPFCELILSELRVMERLGPRRFVVVAWYS